MLKELLDILWQAKLTTHSLDLSETTVYEISPYEAMRAATQIALLPW